MERKLSGPAACSVRSGEIGVGVEEEDGREVEKGKGKVGREGGSRGLRGGKGKNEGRKVEIRGKGKRKGLKGGVRWGQRCWKEEKKTGSQKKQR